MNARMEGAIEDDIETALQCLTKAFKSNSNKVQRGWSISLNCARLSRCYKTSQCSDWIQAKTQREKQVGSTGFELSFHILSCSTFCNYR